VKRGPLEVSVSDDGRTRVRDRFVISAPAAGTLVRIDLEPGDTVRAGAIVARITPPVPAVLDERARAAAEARLSEAVAHLRQADAAMARAQVARTPATNEAARARVLEKAGAISRSQREQKELAEELVQNDLAQAETTRRAAAAEVAAARAALGRGVRGTSDTIAVVAPTDGKVLRVVRDSEGPVTVGSPLLEVGDIAAMEVVVDLLSSDAARVEVGAVASIEAWGGDHALSGRVRAIEPSAFTHVSALGIEEQRVNVIVSIDKPPPTLGDGFRVEARIVIWRGENVLTVPASAVFRSRDRWAVYAVRDGRAHVQPIDVGHRGSLDVEVVGGLAEGTPVIIYPGDRVADGTRVTAR
jgi:HlyD family secretion protein